MATETRHAEGGPVLLVDPETKRRRVRLLVTIVLVGTVAAVMYHYVLAYYYGNGFPLSTFLFKPTDNFNDWNNPWLYAKAFLYSGATEHSVYFPFAFFTVVAASVVPAHVGFAVILVVFLGMLALMLRGWVVDLEESALLRLQYVFILVVLSYPVIFVVDRGNLEMLVFAFIAGFFYFLYRRRSPWLAALMLAAAIAFKLYPATLLVLLVAERRVKVFLLTIVFTVGLTLFGATVLAVAGQHGIIEILRMSTSDKSAFQQYMVYLDGGLQHGHSLWGLIRMPGFLHGVAVTQGGTRAYAVVAVVVFLALAAYAVFFEKERWKLVLLATVPAVFLPYTSADYTLVQMYFPLVFFLNAPRASRWDLVYVALFAALLIPLDYHYFSLTLDGVSSSVVIYPLALIALVALAIVDRQRGPLPAPEALLDAG